MLPMSAKIRNEQIARYVAAGFPRDYVEWCMYRGLDVEYQGNYKSWRLGS